MASKFLGQLILQYFMNCALECLGAWDSALDHSGGLVANSSSRLLIAIASAQASGLWSLASGLWSLGLNWASS